MNPRKLRVGKLYQYNDEAKEKMELVYLESPGGFHFALDFTYVDQVGDFFLELPNGEIFNTGWVR